MGYKTFPAGTPLAAADVMAFLMNQANISCTSTTHPSSPIAGMLIYETDTDRWLYYNGTIWRSPSDVPDLQAGQATSQALAAGYTVLNGYATPDYATLSGFAPSTGIWTCPSGLAGDYNVSGRVAVTTVTAITRIVSTLFKNGTAFAEVSGAPSGGVLTTVPVSPTRVTVAVGDTLSLAVYLAGAASTSYVGSSSSRSSLRITKLS